MKISGLLLSLTILALFYTFTVSTAIAGSMGNGAAQRMKLMVTWVDTTTGKVEIKSQVDQSVHTYKIDATTKVTVGMARGTIDQIKTGQKVENYAGESGQLPKDGQTLTLIWVFPAVPSAAPATP